jgi:hypothetical protein
LRPSALDLILEFQQCPLVTPDRGDVCACLGKSQGSSLANARSGARNEQNLICQLFFHAVSFALGLVNGGLTPVASHHILTAQ